MKKKLINALRTKFSDKGLNATELEELANVVGQNLTDESTEDDINNAVSGIAGYVDIMQKFGTRCASAVENKYKGYVPPTPNPEPSPAPTPNPEPALTMDNIKQMMADAVAQAVAPFKEAEEAKRLAGILSGNEKLRGIPQSFVSRYKLDKEENADTMATNIEQDWAKTRKEVLESCGITDIPQSGSGQSSETDFANLMKEVQETLTPSKQ